VSVSYFLLFLCFRKVTQEIFSELDETKAEHPEIYQSFQRTEEEMEKGHRAATPHHVLKKVPDCRHCGALQFPYEGPAFCCRKGKVDIFTPDVPEEWKRLFTRNLTGPET
jgi:hypothetical protein